MTTSTPPGTPVKMAAEGIEWSPSAILGGLEQLQGDYPPWQGVIPHGEGGSPPPGGDLGWVLGEIEARTCLGLGPQELHRFL